MKEFDSHYVGKCKLCKAFSYFASGFVGTVYSHIFDTVHRCILKCKVTPSQRIRDEPWVVWVAFDTNQGEVLSEWCSCTTGFSQSCNHVMALLYKIEHPVLMGYTNPSCTSVPCRWNDCILREVEPGKSKTLIYELILEVMQTVKGIFAMLHFKCKTSTTFAFVCFLLRNTRLRESSPAMHVHACYLQGKRVST